MRATDSRDLGQIGRSLKLVCRLVFPFVRLFRGCKRQDLTPPTHDPSYTSSTGPLFGKPVKLKKPPH